MTPKIMEITIPASPGTGSTPAGIFSLAHLRNILVVLASAGTGSVKASLVRDGKAVILSSATLSSSTSVRLGFEAPVVLQGQDQILVDASATGKAATAWVEYDA